MYQIYFILEWHSTCFGRSFRPSSGVKDCTYSNRRMSDRYCCLLAGVYEMEWQFHLVPTNKHTAVSVGQMPVAVCTALNSWWRTERLSETCRVSFQNKIQFHLLPTSKQAAVSVGQMPVAVCTVLNCWWRTERPFETCRLSFQNKINLIH